MIAPSNVFCIVVTLDVSQKLIFELKVESFKNNSSISVTREIHRLKLSAATSVLKFALSTTVYTVPLIVAVSPTLALGHLHTPDSK